MTALIFLLTLLSLIILIIITLIAAARRRPVKRKLIAITAILAGYGLIWLFFFSQAKFITVPLGTDICFDDWCATVTNTSRLPDSTTITLFVTMSNHARGIAQKPDEPRVHLIDADGRRYSATGMGKIPLGVRLELHESLQTTLTFTVPKKAKGIRALIEEGPFIADLVFPENEQVFAVK